MKKRVAVLISGRGSNMMALVEAARAPDFPAEVALVISNRPEAPGLQRAMDAGVKALAIDHKAYATREAFDAVVGTRLAAEGIELVCHAGFMRIQTDAFAESWLGRQLNIHPALLPSFKGLHPHRQALEAGVKISGCTVHFVTEMTDSGPIVAQAAVRVLDSDTPATVEARILAVEHKLYPYALALVASGQATIENGRVKTATSLDADEALISPQPRGGG